MARGAIAKQVVEEKIRNAFGADFLGVDTASKKLYVQANEEGEKIVVAIALTCPKNYTGIGGESEGINFDDMTVPGVPSTFTPAEVTNEETENIRKMLAEFGL